jgi:excisionase family DNA binding protein
MHQLSESNNRWWDIREVANYLRVSVAFIRKQVRQGRIPFARAGSKSLRFRKSELDEWMANKS